MVDYSGTAPIEKYKMTLERPRGPPLFGRVLQMIYGPERMLVIAMQGMYLYACNTDTNKMVILNNERTSAFPRFTPVQTTITCARWEELMQNSASASDVHDEMWKLDW